MRSVLLLAVAGTLAGCASNEYSRVPEPTGEWVPANPPSLMVAALPPARPRVWHRRPAPRPVTPVQHTAAALPVAVQ